MTKKTEKKVFNLNSLANHVRFTKMDDKAKMRIIKGYKILSGKYLYVWDIKKKGVVKHEVS